MNSTPQPTSTQDEAAIRAVITAWSAALEAKDLNGITADCTPESVLFDAIPPYQTIGKDAIRQVWANCLPSFPERFTSEHRDVAIQVSGDVAWAHCLHHFIATPPEHPCGQAWLRITVGYRRSAGVWKVLHEHVSVPFNPINSQAWFITDPAVADTPNYGQSCT